MTRAVEQLLEEMAPVIERLVVAQVDRVVNAKIQARELGAPRIHRGRWTAGLLCGEGSVVEHHGRLYLARTATLREPAADSADWQLDADCEH